MSKENKVKLVSEDENASYAKVDHLANRRQKSSSTLPKEVLEVEDHLFKMRDDNAKL